MDIPHPSISGAGKDIMTGGMGADDDFNAVTEMGGTAATRDVTVEPLATGR